jgi:hypothetical protein
MKTELPPGLPEPELAPYTDAQLRFSVAGWPMRSAQELRSALVFRALARAARALPLASPWPERFASAVHDELRHARLCATVGARVGASPPAYDARPVRALLAPLTQPIDRVLRLLLVEVAIGETISMSLFRVGRRAAVEPLTRAALGAILHDEARHQRLGWEALAVLVPALSDEHRAAAHAVAARGLGECEREIAVPPMRWLESGRPFDPAYAALGVIDPEVRIDAFYFAVERHVIPRLTRLGLDGAAAWRDRYRPQGA